MTHKLKNLLPLVDTDKINLKPHNVREFFKTFRGRLKRESYKPRLSDDQKRQRVSWCQRLKHMIGHNFYACYIDEKWFYMSSGRNKEKHLPQAHWETDEEVHIPAPTARSRRYMTKVMFMGVIARPISNFLHLFLARARHDWKNGKIYLKRVSKTKKVARKSRNQKFVPDGNLNEMIKNGDWREHYDANADMTVGELLHVIGTYYDMSPWVTDHLCLSYGTKRRTKVTRVDLTFCDDEDVLIAREIKLANDSVRAITVDDLTLSVCMKKGDEIQVDCSCDSEFMLRVMGEIGEAMRNYYFFLSNETKIYLIIDNAGGHGTNAAIEQYRAYLLETYNIELLHQVPNSPETNLLDLGVWRSMQAAVERLCFRQRHDPEVLAARVHDAWDAFPCRTIEKVYKRWELVLDLILKGDESNIFVELHH